MKLKKLPLAILLFLVTSTNSIAQKVNNLPGDPYSETTANFLVNEIGNAQYTIPIKVPAGTGGLQPRISISYSSRGGNGILGKNWRLGGLSAITRVRATLAQDGFIDGVDFDANDKFALDGQRLIHLTGNVNQDNSQYRTEQATFQRIIAHGNLGGYPKNFTVDMPNGTRKLYGQGGLSKSLLPNHEAVFVWNLHKVTDVHGNYYAITYTRDNGISQISRVDYTGNSKTGLETFASIRFEYEGRADKVAKYVAGAQVNPTQRLKHIKVFYKDELIRTYTLTYEEYGVLKMSLLKSVQECAGASNICAEKINLEWQKAQFSSFGVVNSDNHVFSKKLRDAYSPTTSGDFNGDGRDDVIQFDENGMHILYSSGKGYTASYGYSAGFFKLGNGTNEYDMEFVDDIVLGDVNGDGRTDIVGFNGDGVDLALSKPDNTFEFLENVFVGYSQGWDDKTKYIRTLSDVDGDGRADIVGFGSLAVSVSISNGRGWDYQDSWQNSTWHQFGSDQTAGGWEVAKNPRYLADMNGDGLPDIIGFYNNGVHLAINTGSGFSRQNNGHPVFIGHHALEGWTPTRHISTVADINGDGLADLVGFADVGITLAISNGKDGWIKRDSWNDYHFTYRDIDFKVSWEKFKHPRFLVDLNNDGLADIIGYKKYGFYVALNTGTGFEYKGKMTSVQYTKDGNALQTIGDVNGDGFLEPIIYHSDNISHHINNGKKLYLNKITNASKNILITQKSITNSSIYNRHRTAVYPMMDLKKAYVVSQVKKSNGLVLAIDNGNPYFTTNYWYEGGKINLRGRGFRGFQKTSSTNAETGIRTIVEYMTDSRAVSKRPFKITKLNTNNNFKLSQITHTVAFKHPAPYSPKMYFSYYPSTTIETYKVSNGALYNRTVITRKYDERYGALTEESTIYLDGSTEKINYIQEPMTHNTTKWVFNMPTKIRRTYIASGNVSTMHFDDKYVYINQGNNLNIGLLSSKIVNYYTSPKTDIKLRATTKYTYDAYGNVIQEDRIGDNGYGVNETRSSKIKYDNMEHRLIVETTNAKNHKTIKRFKHRNRKYGLPYEVVDINGSVTKFEFDALGKIKKIIDPTGVESVTDVRAVKAYRYDLKNIGAKYYVHRRTGGSGESWTYYDALGRKVRKLKNIFSSLTTLKTAKTYEDFRYNNNGYLEKSSLPYFKSDIYGGVPEKPIWVTYFYDILGRKIKVLKPENKEVKISYDGYLMTDTDEENKVKKELYKPDGLLAWVEDHDGSRISFQHYPNGQLHKTIAPGAHNVTTSTYDAAGNLSSLSIPDQNDPAKFIKTTYTTNAFGELTQEITASNEVITYHYDKLGRITKRKDNNDIENTWIYDNSNYGKGKISSINAGSGLKRTYFYDQYSRRRTELFTYEGETHDQEYTYDTKNRLATHSYDNILTLKYEYDAFGNIDKVSNEKSGKWYWKLRNIDAFGRITRESTGNQKSTSYTYNDAGQIKSITVNGLLDFGYKYDKVGNLIERKDKKTNLVETFSYDNLHRLSCSDCSSANKRSYIYDKLGNKLIDSDIGTYSLGNYIFKTATAYSGTGPKENDNGVMIHGRGYKNDSFDAKGNRTSYRTADDQTLVSQNNTFGDWGYSRQYTIKYNTSNKPLIISRHKFKEFGSTHVRVGFVQTDFNYDEQYNRIKKVRVGYKAKNEAAVTAAAGHTIPWSDRIFLDETNLYIAPEYEIVTKNDTERAEINIYGGGKVIAKLSQATTNFNDSELTYLYTDNLGSTIATTTKTGALRNRMNYDAWGRPRDDNWDYYKQTTEGKTTLDFDKVDNHDNKGFTGHELLEETDLVHMNGRLYDYNLGIMLNMDPLVQDPTNLQNYNRYSYVMNNPLKFTDPSGYYYESYYYGDGGGYDNTFGSAYNDYMGSTVNNLTDFGATSAFGDSYMGSTMSNLSDFGGQGGYDDTFSNAYDAFMESTIEHLTSFDDVATSITFTGDISTSGNSNIIPDLSSPMSVLNFAENNKSDGLPDFNNFFDPDNNSHSYDGRNLFLDPLTLPPTKITQYSLKVGLGLASVGNKNNNLKVTARFPSFIPSLSATLGRFVKVSKSGIGLGFGSFGIKSNYDGTGSIRFGTFSITSQSIANPGYGQLFGALGGYNAPQYKPSKFSVGSGATLNYIPSGK